MMGQTLKYKNFKGSVEYSVEDSYFYGKILDTNDLVMYEGKDKAELNKAFKEAVDDYINIKKNKTINYSH
jgi:predicted HicB family RNase H-like nuclease